MISNHNFNLRFNRPQNSFSLCLSPWPTEKGKVSGLSLPHLASCLHDRALTCICVRYGEICSQTMFSRSLL